MRRALPRWLTALLAPMALACGVSQLEVSAPEENGADLDAELRARNPCKPDHRLDQAGSVNLQVLGAAKVRAVLVAGADENGISGHAYTFTDASGKAESVSTRVVTCFGSYNIEDGLIDGFTPGGTYTVSVTTTDKCGNSQTLPAASITLPALPAETVPPVVSGPNLSSVNWFGSSVPVIVAVADDDQGMDHVEFFADGTKIGSYSFKSTSAFWSRSLHLYTPPGDKYFVYPTRGETHTFEARAFDLAGNQSSVFKTLTVPN